MANKLLLSCLRQNLPVCNRRMSAATQVDRTAEIIGNREIVGFGFNGMANYIDRPDYPLPAIRFKPNTSDIMALREKEKGDWKKLSIEEKKTLYRASFCQTLVEVQAPTGEWKGQIGVTFMFITFTIWSYMLLKIYAFSPLPISFDEEHRLAQLERMKILEINPITGISSKP